MLSEADLPAPECPQAWKAAAMAVNDLDLATQRAYLKHLAHCPACSAELDAFQKSVAGLRAGLPEVEPSPDLTARILAALPPNAFRVTPFTRVLSFVRRHRQGLAAAAAGVVAAAMAGLWLALRALPPDTAPATRGGCDWIARHQEADGSWDPVKGGGTATYRPALTALAALALSREAARYPREIAAACAALVGSQEPDGGFGPDNSGRMYNHALATWALLSAYDGGRNPNLKAPLDRALSFIRSRQQSGGGWGYLSSAAEPANTAVTAWQVQVLARARQAGFDDAGGHLRRGLTWLRQRSNGHGQFDYTADHGTTPSTPTLNAMGAYTLLTAGGAQPELVQVAGQTIRTLQGNASPDFYQAFFSAAAWDAAGESRRADRVRAGVCSRRETRGTEQGSWAPGDAWGKVGGRLYATSLAVLTLQSHASGQL
jgi:hypothetical protein